jgi:extracellular factor (EF) 3-hydroxypalmitic acid methyl ester biosynthesis protein
MGFLTEQANALFDLVLPSLQEGAYHEGMDCLFKGLAQLKQESCPAAWELFCRSEFTHHPIATIVHQDPITRHSFVKPRGYPGDAALLDLIYTPDVPPEGSSPEGVGVWGYTVLAPEATAVRERKYILSKVIDEVAAHAPSPRILSVACGHLREFGLSEAAMSGVFCRNGMFLALDQDKDSLAEVERCCGHWGVRTELGTVKSILQGRLKNTRFDFVYAAGLYDYLSDRLATRLTARLFDSLLPGGRMLVANFMPGGFGAGYIETFMDWHLIYRGSSEMEGLAAEVPPAHIATRRSFKNRNHHISYLELLRA